MLSSPIRKRKQFHVSPGKYTPTIKNTSHLVEGPLHDYSGPFSSAPVPQSILHSAARLGLLKLRVWHVLLRICTEPSEEPSSSL